MSTTELSRSTLESKDKDELHQIASAMGAKPGSRARKGEIVDLILDLAGVKPSATRPPSTNGAAAATSTATSPAAAAPTSPVETPRFGRATTNYSFDPMADARAEAARKRAREAGEPEPEIERIEMPGADSPAEDSETAANAEVSATSPGNGATSPGNGVTGDDAAGDGRTRTNPQQSNPQQANRTNTNTNNNTNNNNQSGGSDDETGNRKRRRRGRNRDRDPRDRDPRDREPVGSGAPPEDWDGEPIDVAGFLDLRDDGYGFLRVKGMLPSKDDVYVPVKQARQYGLRKGDHLKGASRPAGRSEKNPALLRLDEINGLPPEMALKRVRFEDLTPLFPDERLKLERNDDPTNMTARIVDLISPIGKGQRGLIVSPPKAGKTTIMKEIARSIEINNPEVKLLVLLVDERPEEVTDMRRWLSRGDVVASTFDRPADEHTMVAELTIERAKRLVELGQDVVIILDGITRLARAYNLAAPATGRIMSGGVDSGALYPPKRFFGAARNVEEGGSLTILATALVETGSKMDEVIFEEFKGTGNMELRLDRRTAERRIYPAIDVDASSTRHEELLFERKQLQQVWKLRRVLSGMAAEGANAPGLELLIDRLKTFNNNDEFLAEVARGPVG